MFSVLADYYEKIERTSKRLEMTDYLVKLFRNTPIEVLDKVVYLTQGKLFPEYVGVELGVADKLALRAVALASGLPLSSLEKMLKEKGDIGLVGEEALKRRTQIAFFTEPLTVERVYNDLVKIAKATGPSSQDVKIKTLAGLLSDAQPKEARYLLRIVTERLRLGVRDMTILDALAVAFAGGKANRDILERAYNIHPDLGYIAVKVAKEGVEGAKKIGIQVGIPIRPMLCQRLYNLGEAFEKLGSKFLVEYKYDGERMQIHIKGEEVKIFSRRLEDITGPYPDVVKHVKESVNAEEVILDGECVAVNMETGEFLPFQELMHRRRKYGIEEAIEKYPTVLFLFDCLYLNGEDLTLQPYPVRKEKLKSIVKETDYVKLAEYKIVDNKEELEKFFEAAIERGCEGVVAKSIGKDSIYRAGVRGWSWIKLKRSYQSKMVEPVDLVAVGAFMGKGRRAGTYGALLMAAYDPGTDTFKTVCKLGSGFTDEDLEKLPEMFKPYVIDHKHPSVDSKIEADIWFVPAVVMEVIGDEITLSPLHTCGLDVIKKGSGLAIRFPRFTGRWRYDKSPQDATTVKEIVEMYKAQLKRVAETE